MLCCAVERSRNCNDCELITMDESALAKQYKVLEELGSQYYTSVARLSLLDSNDR